MSAAGALVASLDVSRHPLAEQRVKGGSVGRYGGEPGTVLAPVAQKDDGRKRFLEALRRPGQRLVEMFVGNTGRFGEVVAAQVLAEAQVEEGEVVGLESRTGRSRKGDELAGLQESSGGTAALFEGVTDSHGIFGKGSGPLAGVGVALVSGNREEPCPDPFGFTELGQSRRGPDEHLVGDIGSIVGRTGETGAEVVQLRAEPVIELPKCVTVPLRCACRHIGVTGSAEGPGHEQSLRKDQRNAVGRRVVGPFRRAESDHPEAISGRSCWSTRPGGRACERPSSCRPSWPS